MDLDEMFEVPEEKRNDFIDRRILPRLPDSRRESERAPIKTLVFDYAGWDMDALSVLCYAAERGRYDEFYQRLVDHHHQNLSFVDPEARKSTAVPGAVRTQNFFLDCYNELGIMSRETGQRAPSVNTKATTQEAVLERRGAPQRAIFAGFKDKDDYVM